jgi:hypothetical protein
MTIINKGEILTTGNPKSLIAKLEHKVWSKAIRKDELDFYQTNSQVISQQLVERELQITVYSEEKPNDFIPTRPLLEHVYFHVINY